MAALFQDLRSFVSALERAGELVRVDARVDPRLEVAEIHRRVIAAGGPALFFTNVADAELPLVTNLFGTARRVELAFGPRPSELIAELARLPEELMPPSLGRLWSKRSLLGSLASVGFKRVSRSALDVVESPPRLSRLPALTTWPDDGGPFITLPLVYTQHPDTGQHNLGIYRMQIYDDTHAGMHFQISKGGPTIGLEDLIRVHFVHAPFDGFSHVRL